MNETGLPFVSVIIPVYNDAARLKACLEALEDQTYPKDKYEVIVVDNGSEEDTAAVVRPFNSAQLRHESQPGSYAARNRGIAAAKGAVLAFTDSDCRPASDWLEKGVGVLLATPECGCVGGEIETIFRDPAQPTAAERYDDLTYFRQSELIERHGYSTTANLFAFKRVMDDVGPFDGELKSCGDLEWGQRVSSSGYPVLHGQDVRVTHPARHTLRQLCRRAVRLVGGRFQLKRSFGKSMVEFIVGLLPPLRGVCIAVSCNASVIQKLKVILVMFVVKYVGAWERLRLVLGGRPQR